MHTWKAKIINPHHKFYGERVALIGNARGKRPQVLLLGNIRKPLTERIGRLRGDYGVSSPYYIFYIDRDSLDINANQSPLPKMYCEWRQETSALLNAVRGKSAKEIQKMIDSGKLDRFK